jgi:uncharacterized iron-regulated membrane protein
MFHALRKLWFEPRRTSFRHWMLVVHKWTGVGAGFYLALMGLTGALSVFLPELRSTLVATITVPAGTQRLGLQALQDSIEASNATYRFRAVYPGQSAPRADLFEEQASDKVVHEIAIDPYTAHILDDHRKGATLYDWIRNLHANLLSKEVGRTINGSGGICLLLTGIAGIVVWWPGGRHLKQATFGVSVRKGWHRLSFDLHRLVGVLVTVPLCVVAVTGIGLAFPQAENQIVTALLGPIKKDIRAAGDRSADPTRPNASLDMVRQIAQAQLPGAVVTRIQASAQKKGNYTVSMHLPGDWRDEGDNRVLLDGRSAAVRGVELGRELTTASRVIDGMKSVHYGQFGGVPTRVLTVLVGLTFPLLFVTGIVLWWRRVSRRQRQTADAHLPVVAVAEEGVCV